MDIFYQQKELKGLQLPLIEHQTIFYAVLNWGIGHATRSIPIIEKLLLQNNQIILFSDGEAGKLLTEKFPHLPYHTLPSYNIRYDNDRFPFISLVSQAIIRSRVIRQEMRTMSQFVAQYHPNIVISDNRYGCYLVEKNNYLITHQLHLVLKNNVFSKISKYLVSRLARKFDEVWIPDIEAVSLSAEMSSIKLSIPKRYIGFPIDRYQHLTPIPSEVLILLSGPEPKRTKIQNQLLEIARKSSLNILFIAGDFSQDYYEITENNLHFYSRKKYDEVLPYIAGAQKVICRSGYSTLIDLYCLGKKDIICIPTLGQPEQEYLAQYWSEKGWIQVIHEDEIADKLRL